MPMTTSKIAAAMAFTAVTVGLTTVAWADVEPPNHAPLPIDDEQPSDAAEFPEPVVLTDGNINRTSGDEGHSLSGLSFLNFSIVGYDDKYAGDHGDAYPYDDEALEDSVYGLQFELTGEHPEHLSLPDNPVAIIRPDEGFRTYWADSDTHTDAIDIEITATWVDRYGRQGPTSDPLYIHDSGTGILEGCGGCSTTGGPTTPAIAVAILLLLASIRRGRRHLSIG